MRKRLLFFAVLIFSVLSVAFCAFAWQLPWTKKVENAAPKKDVHVARDWPWNSWADILKYRTMTVSYGIVPDVIVPPTRDGLAGLRVSGSAQFSKPGIDFLKRRFRDNKLIIVDLREESHAFVNGFPVSWYRGENDINRGKAASRIEADEKALVLDLRKKGSVETFALKAPENPSALKTFVKPEQMKIDDVVTEKDLCSRMDIDYVRVPVPDYQRPSDAETDRFVALVKGMDEKTWLHIHCAEGDDRTTTFLAMFDMMHNAGKVSLEDIVTRQRLFGGANLLSAAVDLTWKEPYARERIRFIKLFYAYCRTNAPDFTKEFSQWVGKK